MDAQTAADLGLVSHLVDISEVDATISAIATSGKPTNKYPGIPSSPDSKVAIFAASFYCDENMDSLLSGTCPEGFDAGDRLVARQLKALSRTAPLALKMANKLIDAAGNNDLETGLGMELDGLESIFSTADALEGLSALIEGRKPTYCNE
jgi:enoyl-CoA hydratase/3-hydroxyacyl-CoA dehydrogenase